MNREKEELSDEESGWMRGDWYYIEDDDFAKWIHSLTLLQDRDYQSKYAPPTAVQEAAEEARYTWENLSITSVREGFASVASITARESAARVSPMVSKCANTAKGYASLAAREASAKIQPAIAEYTHTAQEYVGQATRAVLSLTRASQSKSQDIPDLEHIRSDWERPFSSLRLAEEGRQHSTMEKPESDKIYLTPEREMLSNDHDRVDYDPLGVSEEYQRSAEEGYAKMRRKRYQEYWDQKQDKAAAARNDYGHL
ncbi:MAG: hypothetical protein Q9191_004229 [Dirinaria sp. TL-2023a]